MAINKKEYLKKNEIELASFAKCISHPARIAILKMLAIQETCICGEIVNILPLAQSTVSQHLKELRKAGLIQGTISGPMSCYCIDWKTFEKFSNAFNVLSKKIISNKKNNNCC